MMPAAVVRPAVLADAEEIAALHVATWRQTYAHLLPDGFFSEAHAEARRTQWRESLAQPRPDQTVHVAEADGRIIGFASAGPSSDEDRHLAPRQVIALYVDAAHHGTGAGQRLLDAALTEDATVLWVLRDNARAIRFYERNGFCREGTERPTRTIAEFVIARMVRPAAPTTRAG